MEKQEFTPISRRRGAMNKNIIFFRIANDDRYFGGDQVACTVIVDESIERKPGLHYMKE
jgi:hypothetical protein